MSSGSGSDEDWYTDEEGEEEEVFASEINAF